MYPYSLLKEGAGKTQLIAPYFSDNKNYEIHFEINGNINGPIKFILGGISASKHVASSSFNLGHIAFKILIQLICAPPLDLWSILKHNTFFVVAAAITQQL